MPTISRFYGIVIESVSVEPGPSIMVRFADGAAGSVSLAPLIARGGVFRALEDRSLLEQVEVAEHGRYIEWPGEIDLCADALWMRIHGKK